MFLLNLAPLSPWEVDHTDWEAPIEPSSRDKMSHYYGSYQDVDEDTCNARAPMHFFGEINKKPQLAGLVCSLKTDLNFLWQIR